MPKKKAAELTPSAPPSAQDYLSPEDRKSFEAIKERMGNARDVRNSPRDEFDGMGYAEAYDRDAKSSLAYISPTKNLGESRVSTGTTRQALISLVSRASSYNYFTEFSPFDKTNALLRDLGMALEVAVAHANYLDNDPEQAISRGNELYSHGDVISYEDWVVRWGTEKTIPKFDGKVKGVNWTERKRKVFEGCERRTVPGRRFYFGDVFTDTIDRQPFCYEVNRISFADAKQKYGEWERFGFVRPNTKSDAVNDMTNFAEDWQLEDSKTDDLEEILYVDVPNNEMQIVLGGVPMLPVGFPMKWKHGRYPWAHQGGEPIRAGFIYHRSFVRTLLNMQDIENDLWRVLIMLAWKAAMPPVANQTGRIITRRNLMAGEILDVNGDQLKPIFDGSLANTGFIDNTLARIRDNMTGRSVPEIKQGLTQQGLNTATEVTQVQKEAEIALSLNLTALASMQAKCDRLRAMNIMQFAFGGGFSATLDSPRMGDVARYVVEAVDTPESSEALMKREDALSQKEGGEVRIIQIRKNAADFVDRLEARATARPKRSSYFERQEMKEMFQTAAALFGNRLPLDMFTDMFRSVYRLPKTFKLAEEMPAEMKGMAPQAKAQPAPVGAGLENNAPMS